MEPSNNTVFFDNVPSGTYNVREMVPQRWELVSINCGANQNNTAAVNGVNIVLEDGEHVVCTFNNRETIDLRVVKYNDLNQNGLSDEINTDPNNPTGNTLTGWEFTLYDAQGNQLGMGTTSVESPSSGDLGVRYTFEDLFKGETYIICETPQAGWVNSDPGGGSVADPEGLGRPCIEFDTTGFGSFTYPLFGNYEASVTAATVTVSGRVMTPSGRGVPNATVYFTDQNGVYRIIRTNSFGYYRLTGVEVGQSLIINVYSKRFQFPTQVVNVFGYLSNIDFVAQSLPNRSRVKKRN